jgi:hypothetical protein
MEKPKNATAAWRRLREVAILFGGAWKKGEDSGYDERLKQAAGGGGANDRAYPLLARNHDFVHHPDGACVVCGKPRREHNGSPDLTCWADGVCTLPEGHGGKHHPRRELGERKPEETTAQECTACRGTGRESVRDVEKESEEWQAFITADKPSDTEVIGQVSDYGKSHLRSCPHYWYDRQPPSGVQCECGDSGHRTGKE